MSNLAELDAARARIAELEAEVERFHSWAGLMSILDERYPEGIFPTEDDHQGRDSGPRIVSLLRRLDALEAAQRPPLGYVVVETGGLFTKTDTPVFASVEEANTAQGIAAGYAPASIEYVVAEVREVPGCAT